MKSCTGVIVLALLLTSMVAVVPEAQAQQQGGEEVTAFLPPLQLQRFRPAPGPADYLTVFSSGVAPHLQLNLGTFFNYGDDPLRLGTSDTPLARTVAFQSQLDVMAAIGIADQFEVGLLVPWTIRQRGDVLTPLLPSGQSRDGLNATGLNDWRVTGKFQLLSLGEFPVGLAMVAGLSLPVGRRDSLTSDEGLGAEALVVGEYVIRETIRTSANLGFRYRPGQRILRTNVLGNEVTWGLAAHIPFLNENLDLIAELAGAVGVERKPAPLEGITRGEVPVELKGALRYRIFEDFLFQDWAMTGGFGVGVNNGVGTPDWRFFLGFSGQWVTGGWWAVDYRRPNFRAEIDPCELDRDQRGRRLRLSFEEPDCPERERIAVTSDEDRIALLEELPDPSLRPPPPPPPVPEPEPVVEPEPGPEDRALLRQGAIIITEAVNFGVGSADILDESYGVLDDVARILQNYPDILLIRVEGHTDSVGNAQNNLRLSEARAASVRQYLIDRGIEPGRIESIGYGQTRPVADNSTNEGRAENRRVEFNILEMGEGGGR